MGIPWFQDGQAVQVLPVNSSPFGARFRPCIELVLDRRPAKVGRKPPRYLAEECCAVRESKERIVAYARKPVNQFVFNPLDAGSGSALACVTKDATQVPRRFGVPALG